MTSLRLLTPPTVEPITVAEAFRHLRLDGYGDSPPTDDAVQMPGIITAARERAEAYTGRVFAPARYELRIDVMPDLAPLGLSPIRAIEKIEYVDTSGALQTLSPTLYVFEDDDDAPYIRRAYNITFPEYRAEPGCVRITFEAGYTDGQSPNNRPMPKSAIRGMLLLIGHYYENREDVIVGTSASEIPIGSEAQLRPLRTTRIV